MRSRPENVSAPEVYFSSEKARDYGSESRLRVLHSSIATTALDLIIRNSELGLTKGPSLFLDIGSGTGYTGQILENAGHFWLGCDISIDMLNGFQADHDSWSETGGDVILNDVGQGLPFKSGTFDACISVSSLQWLCYSWNGDPRTRMDRFFNSLIKCLKPGAPCVFQYYPADEEQVECLQESAKRAGFNTVQTLLTNSPVCPRNFLILNLTHSKRKDVWLTRWPEYRDYPEYSEPPTPLLGKFLLGLGTDFRPALYWDYNTPETSDILPPSDLPSLLEQLKEVTINDRQDDDHPIFIPEILFSILHPLLMTNIYTEQQPVGKRERLHQGIDPMSYFQQEDNYDSVLNTFVALSLVCKRVHKLLEKISPSKMVYDQTQLIWIQQGIVPPHFPMQLEREEMTLFFIQNLLARFDPQDLRLWRRGLVENNEIFFLNQLFMWIQLFKYLPEHERDILVPPMIVFDLWNLFAHKECYPAFCQKFLGRYLSLNDCTTYDLVQLNQDYRELSTKQKYRSGGQIPAEPEFSLRDRTAGFVWALFGQCDHFTWDPNACDPSCFGGRTKIRMADGSKKEIRFIKSGDLVLSADKTIQRVVSVEATTTKLSKIKKMVFLGDFWITRGHPVLVDGEWMRPDEFMKTVDVDILDVDGIFNLRLDGEHTILVGGGEVEWVCCTLGKYCGPRLEALYPEQNGKYGPQ